MTRRQTDSFLSLLSDGRGNMKPTSHRFGFTLVELLVVITIIAILIALLLPAIQTAREAARKIQCNNQVKQLALGCLTHEQQHHIMPTGGWAYWWFGDPDRGFDRHQPGGWIYNVFPYIEQAPLREIGAGMNFTAKKTAMLRVAQTPLSVLHCPSRRQPVLYPNTYNCVNVDNIPGGLAARSDYAGNSGTYQSFGAFPGTSSSDPAVVDTPAFQWPNTKSFDGVFYPVSELHVADITDGASNTYLVGEKHLNADAYFDGTDWADNNAICEGYDWDTERWSIPYIDSNGKQRYTVPLQDTPGLLNYNDFGSAHAGSCNMSFCDGSVRAISYTIDEKTHVRMCQRNDGLPTDTNKAD
jgi:prepilin-type N-terminal cleavage/methylation domain-containing protein/prepilin-type processing-associated H-X9-DG protein